MFIPQYLNRFVRSEWGHHGKAMVWTPPTARCQHRGVLHSTSAAHFSRPHRLALLGDAGLGWKKHGIRRPAGVYCGSCLFVVVLSVLSLSLSRLSPWHGFLPRLTWIPPSPPALFRFVFSFPYLWWAQLCSRLAQHRLEFAHLAVISMVVSVFSPSLLISNTWSTGFCAERLLHA